jgi:hypothetical protein
MFSGIDNAQSFGRYYVLKMLERFAEEFVLTGSACYLSHPADLDFFAEDHEHTGKFLKNNGFVRYPAEDGEEFVGIPSVDVEEYTRDPHVVSLWIHMCGIHVMLVDDFLLRKEKINPTCTEFFRGLMEEGRRIRTDFLSKDFRRVFWYLTVMLYHSKDVEAKEDKKVSLDDAYRVPYSGLPRGTTITHVPDGAYDENDTPAERG